MDIKIRSFHIYELLADAQFNKREDIGELGILSYTLENETKSNLLVLNIRNSVTKFLNFSNENTNFVSSQNDLQSRILKQRLNDTCNTKLCTIRQR